MKRWTAALRTLALAGVVPVLAACGGSGDLSVSAPGGGDTLELAFPAGSAVEHRLPLRISGGQPPYSATIGEDCPGWVTLFPDQGILAGTAPPAEAGRSFFCTYRVAESDPGFRPPRSVAHGIRLTVTVPAIPPLAVFPPARIDLSVGTFRDVELPQATGGVAPYSYSFSCAGGSLPPGMSFAAATRRFAGTPGTRFRDSCTYSVTDSSATAATVSRVVEVEVSGPVTGTLTLSESVVPGNVIRLRVGERARVTFRPATGGVEPYTYELICPDPSPIGPNAPGTLPPPGLPPYDGLGFGPQTRVLSGTPNAAYRGPDCTYRVTDNATPPATLARSVALIIEDDRAKWRFAPRSLAQHDHELTREDGVLQVLAIVWKRG